MTARKPSIDTRRLCAQYARSQPGVCNARLHIEGMNKAVSLVFGTGNEYEMRLIFSI